MECVQLCPSNLHEEIIAEQMKEIFIAILKGKANGFQVEKQLNQIMIECKLKSPSEEKN